MRICDNTLPCLAEYARNGRVVVFDTETTGGADYDEICQIAAVEYVDANDGAYRWNQQKYHRC